MKIRCASSLPPRSPLVVCFVADGKTPWAGQALEAEIARAKATKDISGSPREFRLFHSEKRCPWRRLGFVGLGKPEKLDAEALRRAAAVAQRSAEQLGVEKFTLVVSERYGGPSLEADRIASAIAEGLVLGAHRHEPLRKEKPKPRRAQDATVVWLGGSYPRFQRGFSAGRIAAEGTAFARDLENLPGNLCPPSKLASAARSLAGGAIKVRVLERASMQRLGMGALLAVAKGSAEPPKLIVLDYAPRGHRKTVCVVGKGLTFDSGGISIKPSAKMDEMRYDMCGAGAVLGLFHALKHKGVEKGRVRVVGIVAAAENMPDGKAQRPGDVVRAMDGHTIEVLNTDAEGRLVLADALAYAKKVVKPSAIVDLATLTGAVVVALGHEVAAVLGNDQALIDALLAAGKDADEPLWQLPLFDCHKEQMKSRFADLANINAGQGGGTIAGAAFLSHFVGDTPWAHLDIAGTAWGGMPKDYYTKGAAGTAVRTLLRWVRSL
ncbi:MAG: leucyl aminopeptidase [Planctomycetota bacterium]